MVIQDQADHLQDIPMANLKDLLDRRATQVQVHQVVVLKDLVDQADIPVVDQAAHHSQVDQADLLNQASGRVHHSLRSQIVSTCRRGLDNCEAKLPANI